MATFGQRLREYREANELTQDDIAVKLGTVKQVVSQYENDKQVPKITMLGELAKKLGVNPMWLMGYDVSIKPDSKRDMIDVTEYSPTKIAIIRSITTLSEDDAKAIAQLLGRIRSDEKRGRDL